MINDEQLKRLTSIRPNSEPAVENLLRRRGVKYSTKLTPSAGVLERDASLAQTAILAQDRVMKTAMGSTSTLKNVETEYPEDKVFTEAEIRQAIKDSFREARKPKNKKSKSKKKKGGKKR